MIVRARLPSEYVDLLTSACYSCTPIRAQEPASFEIMESRKCLENASVAFLTGRITFTRNIPKISVYQLAFAVSTRGRIRDRISCGFPRAFADDSMMTKHGISISSQKKT